ncbi:sec-independent protein translocase TatC [Pedobacter sp. Leaf216]|uniref:group III truncated hemoglobin n=1 Tax=Pedobacter sp. Leaf216 TaxID=1735684 RepID=UPI0006FDCCB2|nr:group III truncated hemoglobin [Pedobacter sp. Leaf216]KQM64608.1 sec-independent protein translocase TatC [Pedobacter sp. Leaf216]
MKKDINDRNDIVLLVDTFYQNVSLNKAIGPIFTDVAKVNWEHHLPKMYDFWESILFGMATYKGNPMLTHFALNEKTPLQTEAFDTWKNLFYNTVDDLFTGPNAELIKQKAQSIADLMHYKINSAPPKIRIV